MGPLKEVTIFFITSTIVWAQVNNREGTQLHPSTENWIKDLLSMALPIRTRPSLPLSLSHQEASPMAQRLKRLPPVWETRVRSLGREDPLEKEMATHSSILAWRIPWTEKPGTELGPAHQNKTQFPPESLPSGSFYKPLILLHQRADRLKTTITEN